MQTETLGQLVVLNALRAGLKQETKTYRASLPVMTGVLFSRLEARTLAEQVDVLEKVDVLANWQDKYRLSESQKEQRSGARKAHTAAINLPDRKAEIVDTVASAELTSFKLRLTQKGSFKFTLKGTLKV